jgi:hypothetical protein
MYTLPIRLAERAISTTFVVIWEAFRSFDDHFTDPSNKTRTTPSSIRHTIRPKIWLLSARQTLQRPADESKKEAALSSSLFLV